jgi:hypothetical protein
VFCPFLAVLAQNVFSTRQKKSHTTTKATTMLLSPLDVLNKGFAACNGLPDLIGGLSEKRINAFCSHYGLSPVDLSSIWYDLITTNIPEAMLEQKEKSDKGFMFFLIAHHYLWTYPKNSQLLASQFGI